MLAAGRAAEAGVPMVRATTTGVSAFVDARGAITAELPSGASGVLVGDVRPLAATSPWVRWGEWFGWSAVVASVALLAVGLRSRA